jgi:hypothetical protein
MLEFSFSLPVRPDEGDRQVTRRASAAASRISGLSQGAPASGPPSPIPEPHDFTELWKMNGK